MKKNKIKNKKTFEQCKEASHASEFSDHNGNVEMCTTLKTSSPQSPQCADALSFSLSWTLSREENRWNLLEANQAAGESGAHGPFSKKAHECVRHVVIPLWMTSEYLFVSLRSPGIAGRTTLPAVCNPNIKPKGFMWAKLSLSQLNCTLRLLKGKFKLTHLMAACK